MYGVNMWIVNTFKPYRYNKYYNNKDKVDKRIIE